MDGWMDGGLVGRRLSLCLSDSRNPNPPKGAYKKITKGKKRAALKKAQAAKEGAEASQAVGNAAEVRLEGRHASIHATMHPSLSLSLCPWRVSVCV